MKVRIPENSPLLRRFPELALFDGPEERSNAWRAAIELPRQAVIAWAFLLCPLLGIGGGLLSAVIGGYVRLQSWGWIWDDVKSLPVVIPIVLSIPFVLWIRREHIEQSLREQLIRRGHPICTECGYDLKGLTDPRCPECGTPFDPMLLKSQARGDTHGH